MRSNPPPARVAKQPDLIAKSVMWSFKWLHCGSTVLGRTCSVKPAVHPGFSWAARHPGFSAVEPDLSPLWAHTLALAHCTLHTAQSRLVQVVHCRQAQPDTWSSKSHNLDYLWLHSRGYHPLSSLGHFLLLAQGRKMHQTDERLQREKVFFV